MNAFSKVALLPLLEVPTTQQEISSFESTQIIDKKLRRFLSESDKPTRLQISLARLTFLGWQGTTPTELVEPIEDPCRSLPCLLGCYIADSCTRVQGPPWPCQSGWRGGNINDCQILRCSQSAPCCYPGPCRNVHCFRYVLGSQGPPQSLQGIPWEALAVEMQHGGVYFRTSEASSKLSAMHFIIVICEYYYPTLAD